MDEVTINMRALTYEARNEIADILGEELKLIKDDDNYTALILLRDFND